MTDDALREHLDLLRLVDHHAHGSFRGPLDRATVENALNEADTDPVAGPSRVWDTQLGFAIRRWCAEPLDLPRHVSPDDYWNRRVALGDAEVTGRLLGAAGVGDWLVDTGFAASGILTPAELAVVGGGRAHEITRLEPLAEEVILAGPDHYAERFAAVLADRVAASASVGVKSVLAYRSGFGIDLSRPTDAAVAAAASRWSDRVAENDVRIDDPVLIVNGLYAAVDLGLPVQLHVGFGDRDLDLRQVNPLLLLDFLRAPDVAAVPVMLLHCYPYEREAGYLAQAFGNVHLDVGLATHFLGARGADLIARSLELAPFEKLLYSSDGYGPPELHFLGARIWRNGMAQVLGEWVASDQWSLGDAKRVADMVGRTNAERVYRL